MTVLITYYFDKSQIRTPENCVIISDFSVNTHTVAIFFL